MVEIRASTVLPAERSDIELRTGDGARRLGGRGGARDGGPWGRAGVGRLERPEDGPPVARLVCLHPLPTAQGMMDSHVLRKASYRLPALAGLAVLRFNTRGTSSARGTSEGSFGEGETERYDVAAAL